jgi:protein TonB
LVAILVGSASRNRRAPERQLTWIELTPPEKNPNSKRSDDPANKQIVQSKAGEIADKPAKDAFWGEKNRVVDRQTVNKAKVTQMGQAPKPARAPKVTKQASTNQAAAQKNPQPNRPAPLAKFGLAILPADKPASGAQERAEQPRWATPGVQPQDYVVGMKESDQTALNTREYLYFGYFQRIRERLELEWNGLLREALHKYYRSGRQLASDMEYSTKLLVVLNPRGEIVRVKVLGESGARELDDVAVRAFNKAGPFPNPPKGLVSHNGEVEVPWTMNLRS